MKRTKFGALVFGIVVVSVWAGTKGEEPVARSPSPAPGSPDASHGPSRPAPLGGDGHESAVIATNGLKLTTTPAPERSRATARCPEPAWSRSTGDYWPGPRSSAASVGSTPRPSSAAPSSPPPAPCQAKTVHKHFCMDRYEYPNKVGRAAAVIGATWYESRDACKAQGKRLCARHRSGRSPAKGQERLPVPVRLRAQRRGLQHRQAVTPKPERGRHVRPEAARRRVRAARPARPLSGPARPASAPTASSDMARNVDEWVVNESGYALQERLQGRLLGPRAHAVPPDDHRPLRARSRSTSSAFAAAPDAAGAPRPRRAGPQRPRTRGRGACASRRSGRAALAARLLTPRRPDARCYRAQGSEASGAPASSAAFFARRGARAGGSPYS
jgi:hypothetical protein